MAKKIAIPLEFKYDFALGAWTTILKGFLYAIRKEYGAVAALEIYETVTKMDDRVRNMTKSLMKIFKIEGNDIEKIEKFYDIWWDITGAESSWLERSKTSITQRITECPFKTEPKDISEWDLIFPNIVVKTINPMAAVERPKSMCAGDPYCEFIYKIEV
ncbi:MAG: hypothetical protein ACFFCD_09680 [Promethearchaeota archaeon]